MRYPSCAKCVKLRRISVPSLIGETIEIDGEILGPSRFYWGKRLTTAGAATIVVGHAHLATLSGWSRSVPGGMIGTNVKLNRPGYDRFASAIQGLDGFMEYPFNETTKQEWNSSPNIRNAYKTLVPLAANSAWSPALGPAHLPWLFPEKPPEHWPAPTKPDIWFCYRTNPARFHRGTRRRWPNAWPSFRSQSRLPTPMTRPITSLMSCSRKQQTLRAFS